MIRVKLLIAITFTFVLGSSLTLNHVQAYAQNALIPSKEIKAPITKENFARLQNERDEIVSSLLRTVQSQANQEEAKEQKRRAIELLGLYRAPEAVATLTEQISIELPVRDYWRDDLLGEFAALDALIQIGNPSIIGVFDYLRANTLVQDGGKLTPAQLHLFAYVLRQIDGQEIGLERIKGEITRAANQRKKPFLALSEVYLLNESEIPLYRTLYPERDRINAALKALKPLPDDEAEKDAWELGPAQ